MTSLTTRFAPSPTGRLHLGHAYAAIVAHDLARAHGGRFLLRIEDIDGARARAEFEQGIFEDLAWLGLGFNGPVLRQSERMPRYGAALEALGAMGLLYPCFCTRKEIRAESAAISAAPHAGPEGEIFGPVYPGTCRRLSLDERKAREAGGDPFVLRLDMIGAQGHATNLGRWPRRQAELWLAPPTAATETLAKAGDIVLARKDIGVSYHLAVVVDDAESGITHVTRGEDLLAATPVQMLLQALLDLPTPRYGHHALVRDEQGNRLAKRADSLSLEALRAQGLTPARIRARLPVLPDFGAALVPPTNH